ncbi:uncharacterized protein J5F26_010203 [Ciconia maguari]
MPKQNAFGYANPTQTHFPFSVEETADQSDRKVRESPLQAQEGQSCQQRSADPRRPGKPSHRWASPPPTRARFQALAPGCPLLIPPAGRHSTGPGRAARGPSPGAHPPRPRIPPASPPGGRLRPRGSALALTGGGRDTPPLPPDPPQPRRASDTPHPRAFWPRSRVRAAAQPLLSRREPPPEPRGGQGGPAAGTVAPAAEGRRRALDDPTSKGSAMSRDPQVSALFLSAAERISRFHHVKLCRMIHQCRCTWHSTLLPDSLQGK